MSVQAILYPYSSRINPHSIHIGADLPNYVEAMAEVERDPWASFKIWGGSRPLLFLLVYSLSGLLHIGSDKILKFLPLLLNPLLTLSTYLMVYMASKDHSWASLSALLTATGFQMTVGMFSFFLANLLGLALINVSLGLLFASMRDRSPTKLLLASALGSLTLYVHPWTTTQYTSALALIVILSYLRKREPEEIAFPLLYLSIIGAVDLMKRFLIGGVEIYGSLSSVPPSLRDLKHFGRFTLLTYHYLYLGLLSNTPLWISTALGFCLLENQQPYSLYLTCLLATSSTYAVLAPRMMSRIIYNLPTSIYSANLLNRISKSKLNKPLKIAIITFIITYMINYLFRSLKLIVPKI